MKPQTLRSLIFGSLVLIALLCYFAGTFVERTKNQTPPVQEIQMPNIFQSDTDTLATVSFYAMSLSDQIDRAYAVHSRFDFAYVYNTPSNMVSFILATPTMDPFQSTMNGDLNDARKDINIDAIIYYCYELDGDPVYVYIYTDHITLSYPKGSNSYNYYTFFNPDA